MAAQEGRAEALSLPVVRFQFDGCTINGLAMGGLDCNPTVGAELIAFETGGLKRPMPCDVRRRVLNSDGTPDLVGGTRPSQVADAALRGWGVHLDVLNVTFADAWELGNRPDRAIGISINYGPVAPTQFDGSPGFTGNHQILMHMGAIYDPLADSRKRWLGGSLWIAPQAPDVWPKDLVREAAGRLPGMSIGRASIMVAEAPTARPKDYAIEFDPGSFFAYEVRNNVVVDRHRDHFPRETSARCAPPVLRPWPGHFDDGDLLKKRLAMMTAGRLSGLWVEPGAPHVDLVRV